MQIIRVFLASSSALKEERVQIENWISGQNALLHERGIILLPEKLSSSFSKTRKQEEFNKHAVNSQVFVCLVDDRVGDFTKEEFLQAYDGFQKSNLPKLILVYFKEAQIEHGNRGPEFQTVLDLKKEISRLGQVWNEYSSVEGLLLHLHHELGIYLDGLNGVRMRPHSSLPNMAHFVGRKRELARIDDALEPESRAWGVMIVGPGGIGKTSLAVAAAHRAPENDFPIKVFLSAKQTALTAEGEAPILDYALPDFDGLISELALELGVEDIKQTPVSERVSSVRRRLLEKKALIIFDDIDTFDKNERERLFQFLNRLPPPCKAIVTSRRRRADADTRTIRLDRLQLDEALQLMNELAGENAALARASDNELQTLYEMAGGNPLLINWVCGQLARDGGGCSTISEACKLLESARPGNDPLEFVFGNLLDTFGPTEIAVLSALTHFTQPAESDSIGILAQLPRDTCEAALDRLADRALLDNDENRQHFFLPKLTATFLRRVRPEAVEQTGDRLLKNVYALVRESGNKKYESFPRLEAQWLSIAMALQLMQKSHNIDLQWFCDGISTFLDFSGRQDEWLSLCQIAEEKATKVKAFNTAATRAYQIGCVFVSRKQADEVSAAAARCEHYWKLHIDQVNLGKSEEALILPDKHEQAMISRLNGLLQQLNGNYSGAREELLKAHQLHESAGRNRERVQVMNDLGLLHTVMHEIFAAELYLTNALDIAKEANLREETLICLRSLSRLKHDFGQPGEAQHVNQRGLRLAQELNCSRLIKEFANQLA